MTPGDHFMRSTKLFFFLLSLVSLAKGRNLFTSRYWSMMGQKQPSWQRERYLVQFATLPYFSSCLIPIGALCILVMLMRPAKSKWENQNPTFITYLWILRDPPWCGCTGCSYTEIFERMITYLYTHRFFWKADFESFLTFTQMS